MYYHPTKKISKNSEPIIFIHGTGMDHTVWTLPVRHFSRKKRAVMAIDLPGHGNNPDKPLDSIGKISNYIFNFLDENSIKKCSIVGHSMGSLIALEMASSQPNRINAISMIGTAFPMQVNEALLESAKRNPEIAINILTFMGYSYSSRLGGNKTPGVWMTESTKRLYQKSKKGIIYKDLKACSEFSDGLEKARMVKSKVQLILGSNDFLTPRIKAQDLIDNFKDPLVEDIQGSGHSLMMEEPNKVLDFLLKLHSIKGD
jgi:pimeloyl-ACP methyl ester carboxylesterase